MVSVAVEAEDVGEEMTDVVDSDVAEDKVVELELVDEAEIVERVGVEIVSVF